MAELLRWLVVPDEADTEPSRDLVGGKAWSLWRMRSLGLRVPPAFVVTTEACAAYFAARAHLPDGLAEELAIGIGLLEAGAGPHVRLRSAPAAGLGPVRCRDQHARHDGHHPRPGLQRRGRGGAGRRDR